MKMCLCHWAWNLKRDNKTHLSFFLSFSLQQKKKEKKMSKSSSYLGDTYRNAEEGSFGVLNFRDLAISTEDSDADHKK
jgi:hypothetical protein